jgi:coenzyme PQQ synthesis protein D (PqqD)
MGQVLSPLGMNSVELAPDVLYQEIEGETVLLDLKGERYFSLDDVGTRFWQLAEQHDQVEAIVAAMLAEFDVDEATLRADLDALLERLAGAGLIVRG